MIPLKISLCFTFLLLSLRGEGGLKVTESGHLLNQNQMINYFFRGFIPLKIFIPEKQEDSQSLWLKENYVKITEILYVTVLWEVAFHCLA